MKSLYKNKQTGEKRELDSELIESWFEAGNPKALDWEPCVLEIPKFSKEDYDSALQMALDEVARSFDYWGMNEVGQWAAAPNTFQSEALSLFDWASRCWQYRYGLQIEAGLHPDKLVAMTLTAIPTPT